MIPQEQFDHKDIEQQIRTELEKVLSDVGGNNNEYIDRLEILYITARAENASLKRQLESRTERS